MALIAYGSNQRSASGKLVSSLKLPFFEGLYKPLMPVGAYALATSRHMHQYGTTREQLAAVAVSARQWAQRNPEAFTQAWLKATQDLQHHDNLPSARALQTMQRLHGGEHAAFGLAASDRVRAALLAQPLTAAEREAALLRVNRSWQEQADIEAADHGPGGLTFEAYRQQFLDPARLVV